MTNAERQAAHRARRKKREDVMASALESIARPFPPKCNWEDKARACQIVARQALGLSA